jgi:hypothetical protein
VYTVFYSKESDRKAFSPRRKSEDVRAGSEKEMILKVNGVRKMGVKFGVSF